MWKCPKCGRSFSREGQSHYCGKIETIDQYIEEQDESVRPYLNEVRCEQRHDPAAVYKTAPEGADSRDRGLVLRSIRKVIMQLEFNN